MSEVLRKNAWVLGLAALLVALIVVTKVIQPSFGVSGLESIARAALPFAFATAGMSIQWAQHIQAIAVWAIKSGTVARVQFIV